MSSDLDDAPLSVMIVPRRWRSLASRPCSMAARAAIFFAFAAVLTGLDAPRLRTWSAVNPRMDVSYVAINAGHPFYTYLGDANDLKQPASTDPAKLVPYFKSLFNDAGIEMSMSAMRVGVDTLGILKDHQFNDAQLPFFAYIAMLIFGASLMLVSLPGVAAILVYVPLLLVTLAFSDALGAPARAVEAFGLAILGVYALVLVFSRWRRGTLAFIVTTTLFVAWLNMMRQGLIEQKLALDALLIAMFAISSVVSRKRRAGYWKKPAAVAATKAVSIAVSFPVAFAYTVLLSVFLSVYYGLPYSSQYIPSHGNGHPLYLSTGYVANPFNTAWDDDIFQVNCITLTDRFFRWTYPEWGDVIQPALRHEYERIVIEDPMLLIRNVIEKTRLMHWYLTDTNVPSVYPYDLIYTPRDSQRAMYGATLVGLAVLAGAALRARYRWLWGALLPLLAVVAV
jgi:hypothetical protein